MIQVKYSHKGSILSLEVSGHAEMGEPGKDLLCAAATAYIYALAQTVEDSRAQMKSDPVIEMEDGHALVSIKPDVKYLPGLMVAYNTILNGFRVLEENYPDRVCIERTRS